MREALNSFIKVLQINPAGTEVYHYIGATISQVIFREPAPEIQTIIVKMLDFKTAVDPRDILPPAIRLLKFDPVVTAAIEMKSDEIKLLVQKVISDLSDLPLLLKIMSVSPIADLDLETVFTDIRSGLLHSISEIIGQSEVLSFQSALALQCFTNEYVYSQTENESQELEALEVLVGKSLLRGEQPSPQSILCLAAYKSLSQYDWCHLLIVTTSIEEVFRRQVTAPEEEASLKPNISLLRKITDKVSAKVRKQYEENPYPRWVNLALPARPVSISVVAKDHGLCFFDAKINNVSTPDILIGGCGTGQHSMSTAARFKNSSVLAIDLSLASLAYAKRQSQAFGFQNIKYIQGDILDLFKLERQFDIVESSGVLHHMNDPMTGWRSLTDRLKPSGIMRISLYSEAARQDVVKIQEEIRKAGIEPSDDAMKKFRQDIIKSSKEHHQRILKVGDFYSTSELRDLLFHVQEQRFTLTQIARCLSDLSLKFCGFELPNKTIQDFKVHNNNPDDFYDLYKWDRYEEANPSTFINMYQFWCQKIT